MATPLYFAQPRPSYTIERGRSVYSVAYWTQPRSGWLKQGTAWCSSLLKVLVNRFGVQGTRGDDSAGSGYECVHLRVACRSIDMSSSEASIDTSGRVVARATRRWRGSPWRIRRTESARLRKRRVSTKSFGNEESRPTCWDVRDVYEDDSIFEWWHFLRVVFNQRFSIFDCINYDQPTLV